MEGPNDEIQVRKKWVRLGLVLAFLHFVFLLLVLVLLQIDLYIAIVVAIGVSLIGGSALTIFVLYIY